MNESDYELNTIGIVLGFIAWLSLMIITAGDSECARNQRCGADDLVLSAIIGIGMLVPSWLLALVISNLLKKHH
jgi:hypothetical protein